MAVSTPPKEHPQIFKILERCHSFFSTSTKSTSCRVYSSLIPPYPPPAPFQNTWLCSIADDTADYLNIFESRLRHNDAAAAAAAITTSRINSRDSILASPDIVGNVLEFVGNDQYLFFAPVSGAWRDAWFDEQRHQSQNQQRRRPTTTRPVTVDTTVRQLQHSIKWGGLRRDDKEIADAAARAGNLEILQYIVCGGGGGIKNRLETWNINKKITDTYITDDIAVASITSDICAEAAKHGQLHVLQWARALDNGGPAPWDERTCAWAARRGHCKVLLWARANGCPWSTSTCQGAALSGRLDILIWALLQGCEWDGDTCAAAAGAGRGDILKWAIDHGCYCDTDTCAAAARWGKLRVLKWARRRNCPWNADTCSMAARGGHLEVLRWARENGCDWNSYTCYCAARWGHLEVLQWSRTNGCSWNRLACLEAALIAGHKHVTGWMMTSNGWMG